MPPTGFCLHPIKVLSKRMLIAVYSSSSVT